MNKFIPTMAIGMLIVAPALMAQTPSGSYSFKGNSLGMSLSDFKKTNSGPPIPAVRNANGSISPYIKNMRLAKGQTYQEIYLPLCSDTVPGYFNNVPDGEVVCDPNPKDLELTSPPQSTMIMDMPTRSINYVFYKDRLYRIGIDFYARFFPKVYQAFVDRYGKPSEISETPYANALGAKWNGENVLWFKDQQGIILTEGSGDGPVKSIYDSFSTIIFIDKSLQRPAQNKATPNF